MTKLIKILILIFIVNFKNIYSDDLPPGELGIYNKSSSDVIKVNIYPVGAVFNGDKEYKLLCKNQGHIPNPYIVGCSKPDVQPVNGRVVLNQDNSSAEDWVDGAIGYGKYRIDFYKWNGSVYQYVNYCYIDFGTSDYPFTGHPYLYADIQVEYNNANSITYEYCELPSDRTIKIWDQTCFRGPNAYQDQNKSGFKTTADDNGKWLKFPLDGREYQGEEPWGHETLEKLFVWMDVLAQHQPKIVCGNFFELAGTENIFKLKSNSNTKFYIGDVDNNASCNAYFKINSGYLVWLESNTQIICEKGSSLFLKNNSRVRFDNSNSKIIMKPGSRLCIEGTPYLYGPGYNPNTISGSIIIQGRVGRFCLNPAPNSPIFKDSVKVLLDTNSILELDDSTTWTFEGNETGLLCDSGSTIKFGKGSKLIFTDGARINAKHTKFTTYDSNTTWNGIYLSGLSYDTLQYCTIENALNGINIEDKISYFGNAPATEISNCTFSNKTSEQLLNMVYVNNSANVMIRKCSSSSLINDGFASGVIIEYCTAGGVNVIDNELEHVTTGIDVIQSSPYIARNTIIGAGSSGTGIYLDNSNGTIEYNIVNNFNKSAVLYYSSPYMLKNTFDNDNSVCAEVTAYSAPVMKPIVSGTTLRWLGGNNYFTGQPNIAGITLVSEGHPLMDSGYNVVSVGNSLYMQGTISRVLYMRVNNWYDDPPESGKFDISGEEYDYSEYFDGYTIPPPDYNELNEIGFGYYDTVYVDEIGGDNPTAEDIFIFAYRKEMERKFVEAVVLYKNVISNFKTSNYAITSLSRIFNCLEKSYAGISQYSAVKSYYDGIKNSNTYPERIREHAEDLAIKAKVRMGFIEEAISDYQTIINNNGNNPKGIHAQVNKLVLMNMNSSGDNMMIGNRKTSENYKANLLSLITGKNIQSENRFASNIPKKFKFYQNYPNPFNPKTRIKYEIPHHAQVTLTIYDLTGREILQLTEFKQAGSYSYTFDGTKYASGLYLYKLHAGTFVETKKMVLIK